MKNSLIILLITTLFACNTNTNSTEANTETETTSKTTIVSNFLTDISTLEKIEGENPIVLFQSEAANKADKTMPVSKDNKQDVLTTAKQYSQFVITTGDHTIVQVNDIENCQQSGSWGACMPYGKGYIKKGKLNLKEDFINNIIGLPDAQERTAYFFN